MLEIVYQDEACVVVNKPAGMLVHRSKIAADSKQFMLQILRNQLGQHVFPVHRLDRPTSGAMVWGLNEAAARDLSAQFMAREVGKYYWAVVRGWAASSDLIDYPLIEEWDKLGVVATDRVAQVAHTRYRTLAQAELPIVSSKRYSSSRYSWLELEPLTGRRHQLRRHLKHIFHPIVGDTTHGDLRQNHAIAAFCGVSRLMLHAHTLVFTSPVRRERIVAQAAVDEDWRRLFNVFQWGLLQEQGADLFR